MLYQLPKLVENSILLDSFISERNNSNKAYNTAFMHKLYGVCRVDDKPYLAKITVEEFANGQSGTLMRMYNFQDIKIEPIRLIEFTEEQLARSVLNGSDISTSELFKVVKHYDNDFYINHSEQKSQELSSVLGLQSSQGLNALDSKEPIRLIEFTEEQLARSVLKGSNISISDLFKVVKHYDNDFYINHSEQKSQELFSVLGLQLSKGLNILDSDVIIHQSRDIVKGMQQENNAEQLSFFEIRHWKIRKLRYLLQLVMK